MVWVSMILLHFTLEKSCHCYPLPFGSPVLFCCLFLSVGVARSQHFLERHDKIIQTIVIVSLTIITFVSFICHVFRMEISRDVQSLLQ